MVCKPRPLKFLLRPSPKINYLQIGELIRLIKFVASNLKRGIDNREQMVVLVQNLRKHGPHLEIVAKETMDRSFVVFRNFRQDNRLHIMTRVDLLELIDLRAKDWGDAGFNSHYKTKQDTNINLRGGASKRTVFWSTSTFGAVGAATAATKAAEGSAKQTEVLFGPGEVIRNTMLIPGNTFCKDEVIIRNAERSMQITAPTEKNIYSDNLPMRLHPVKGSGQAGCGGACSPLALSNFNQPVLNFMTAPAAAQQQQFMNLGNGLVRSSTPSTIANAEYKTILNVGQHRIKIIADSSELAEAAESVLDDHFNNAEFLASDKVCTTFDRSFVSPIPKPSSPTHSMMGKRLDATTPLADSAIELNHMATQFTNNTHAGHDEVFRANDGNQMNRLARLRKNYFSRHNSENGTNEATASDDMTIEIVYERDRLMYHSNSPQSRALPANWNNICEKFSAIDLQDKCNRFNGENHLMKSARRHSIVVVSDETTSESDQDNE